MAALGRQEHITESGGSGRDAGDEDAAETWGEEEPVVLSVSGCVTVTVCSCSARGSQ